MPVSVGAQGFTAHAETNPDGSITLRLTDASGHDIAVGRGWDGPEPEPARRDIPAERWEWGEQAAG